MTLPIICKSLENFYDVNLFSGQISHCCKIEPVNFNPAEFKKLQHNYFDLNSQTVRARTDLSKGIKTSGCKECWNYEDKNLLSFRQIINDSEIQKQLAINLQITSLCNLACFYCTAQLSSTIQKYKIWVDEKTGEIINSMITRNDDINLGHINEFIKNSSDHLHEFMLSLTGGEPFLLNNFEEDILILAETFLSKNDKNIARITISTNSSGKKEQILNFYENIKKSKNRNRIRVSIILSLENIEQRAEYVRHGLVWSKFEENFKVHRSNADDISVRMTLNAFSVVNMVDFVKYFANYNVRFIYNYVNQNFYRINILDNRFKSELIKVEDYIKSNNLDDKFENHFYENLTTMIENDVSNANIFRKAITNMDSIKNTNWRTVFPEYINWFDERLV